MSVYINIPRYFNCGCCVYTASKKYYICVTREVIVPISVGAVKLYCDIDLNFLSVTARGVFRCHYTYIYIIIMQLL